MRDSIDGSEHEQNSDDDDHAHRYNQALLLTRLLLLSSLLEQIIQSRFDPSLINVAPLSRPFPDGTNETSAKRQGQSFVTSTSQSSSASLKMLRAGLT